jgi:hypothetical protein
MEKLEQIMDGNELCINALIRETERLKEKIKLIDKAVYEGYYDEIGNYVVNFQRDKLEDALKKVFDAKEVNILH